MEKRILGFVLLTLLVSSLIIGGIGVVSADKGNGIFKTLWSSFFGGIGGNSFSIGNYQVELSRILLAILLVLLVYSISDFLPFLPNKEGIKWSFAIVIALLRFLFVKADTIKNISDTYGALGIALTSLIPLIILLAFSFKLSTHENFKPFAPFLNKFMFLIFGIWMVVKWSTKTGDPYVQVYLISALIAGVWIFIGDFIWKKMHKQLWKGRYEAGIEQSEIDQINRSRAKITDLKQALTNATNNIERGRLKVRIRELEENIGVIM